jgi:hypothetical protein
MFVVQIAAVKSAIIRASIKLAGIAVLELFTNIRMDTG